MTDRAQALRHGASQENRVLGVRPWHLAGIVIPPLVLVAVSLGARVSWRWLDSSVIRFVDVMRERNIPTWYATSLLLVGGLLAWLAALLARRAEATDSRHVWAWRWLAALLVVMSLDELVSIHEQVGRWLRPIIQPGIQGAVGSSLDGILRTGWIVPGIVAVAVILVGLVLWFRTVDRRVGVPVSAGFLILVAGGLGMEAVGSLVYDYPIPLLLAGHVEELLELWGASVMVYGVSRAFDWSTDDGVLRASLISCRPSRGGSAFERARQREVALQER